MAGQPGFELFGPWADGEDVLAVRALWEPGIPAKYIELPKSRYAFFQVDKVLRDGAPVGLSPDLGYVVNEQDLVSLATVDRSVADPGTEVTVLWGEEPNSPVHVGMPGPVNRQKLIRISAGLGLGQSARFLRKQQNLFWRFLLPGAYRPTKLLME